MLRSSPRLPAVFKFVPRDVQKRIMSVWHLPSRPLATALYMLLATLLLVFVLVALMQEMKAQARERHSSDLSDGPPVMEGQYGAATPTPTQQHSVLLFSREHTADQQKQHEGVTEAESTHSDAAAHLPHKRQPMPNDSDPEAEWDAGYRLAAAAAPPPPSAESGGSGGGGAAHPHQGLDDGDADAPQMSSSRMDRLRMMRKQKLSGGQQRATNLQEKEEAEADAVATAGDTAASRPSSKSPPSSKSTPGPAPHWSYNNPRTGPYNWGNLDPSWAVCSSGHRQSPIDFKVVDPVRHPSRANLASAVQVDPSLRHILFNYAPANVTLHHHDDNTTSIDEVVNTGHTIQVGYETGSEIFVAGTRFDLMQFHFHSPSEHTLNGKHFDMELHLVHADPQTGALAVVGLWLEVPAGVGQAVRDLRGQYSELDQLNDDNTQGEVNRLIHVGANPFLDSLEWAHLPALPGGMLRVSDHRLLNVFDVLPFDQGYITYQGSLTTPPCSEGVTWLMLKSPVSMSIAQRNAFLDIFGTNSRPTQLLHGRNVTMTVDSDRPSHLPKGVSHDLFLLVLGGLLVVALLLFFAILFLCTRSQHRLARAASDSRTRLYALLSPEDKQAVGTGRADLHIYEPISPDMESGGDRQRAQQQQQQQQQQTVDSSASSAINSSSNARASSQRAAPGAQYGSVL